jgi:NTE family protein
MARRQLTGLILPGGGARGAYQVGVLKAIAEFFPRGQNPFPILVGVSVGAINTAALASRPGDFTAAVAWLEKLWSNLTSDHVFRTDFGTIADTGLKWLFAVIFGGLGEGNPKSLLDTAPLRKLIEREIRFDAIETGLKSGWLHAAAVTASSYSRGKAVTFFEGAGGIREWSRARREGVRERLTPSHIMASVSLPFVFPPEVVDFDYYGDGSLRLTAPLSPAIHFGADRILIIGSRDERPDPVPSLGRPAPFPTFGSIAGSALDILFNDNLREDIERAQRINRTVGLLPKPKRGETPLRQVQVLTLQPSQDIRKIAKRHIGATPWTIRLLLKGVGAWGHGWQLPSYLLFEPGFCRELMRLGYRDALKRKAELATFLAGE